MERDDIVVLSGNPRQLSTLVLLIKARIAGAQVVWWGHYWSSTSRRWRQVLRHLLMTAADALLFYTDDEVEAFEKDAWKFKKAQIVTSLNNGIDIKDIRRLRIPYRARERKMELLFIGRLTPKANLGLGLDALEKANPELTLHVIGDGEMRESLQNKVHDLGLQDRVIWHGALIDEERIAAIANRCKAFLYPGEVGLSLIHGMAYGLPAFVHDMRTRHMPEIAVFRDQKTGRQFQYGSAVSFAAIINDTMSNPEELEEMSACALSTIGPDFTTKGMQARFEALVRALESRK